MVSALFALHPLYVESVVWIAERKDVLSIFFGLSSLLAYLRYATRGSRWSLLVCFLLFVCSLMAKQTLVTLPLVFLLLDYWPFARIPRSDGLTSAHDFEEPERATPLARRSIFNLSGLRLLAEKSIFARLSRIFHGRCHREIREWGGPQFYDAAAAGSPGQRRGGLRGVSR